MRNLKTHYFGLHDGRAHCGAHTDSSHLTLNAAKVTCRSCLRHLVPRPRKSKLNNPGVRTAESKPEPRVQRLRGGLRDRVEALKLAIQATNPSGYDGGVEEMRQCYDALIVDLAKEAQALVDYLEGVTRVTQS